MTDLVVIDASVLLAIALPDPQANNDYAMTLLFAIDKGDVAPGNQWRTAVELVTESLVTRTTPPPIPDSGRDAMR